MSDKYNNDRTLMKVFLKKVKLLYKINNNEDDSNTVFSISQSNNSPLTSILNVHMILH